MTLNTMIPCQYSETVAVAEVPSYQQTASVTYCDVDANTRCRTGVVIGPGLCPASYRDSVIVYGDSTRRRYVSRVEYVTRLKPLSYSDTSFTRPRSATRSFATWVDHHAEAHRKWYKSSVRLEPRKYTSSAHARMTSASHATEEENRKSELSSSTDADASMESLDYLSDGIGSSPDTPSPLRLTTGSLITGSRSPLDNGSPETTTITYTSFRRQLNQNEASHDDNANEVPIMHRSGPFIYNAPKRRTAETTTTNESFETRSYGTVNGEVITNGYHDHGTTNGHHHPTTTTTTTTHSGVNGYLYSGYHEDDVIMDL